MQKDGMAMGSPLSPTPCRIFMTKLETQLMAIARHKSDLWSRYVNDMFVLWNHGTGNPEEFLSNITKIGLSAPHGNGESGNSTIFGCNS